MPILSSSTAANGERVLCLLAMILIRANATFFHINVNLSINMKWAVPKIK